MYYLYALKCEELVLYVGQTTDLGKRFADHIRRDSKCGSADIPKNMDFYIEVLKYVNTKKEATHNEQFYYDTLKPLYNKYRPGTPFKQIMSFMGKNKKK